MKNGLGFDDFSKYLSVQAQSQSGMKEHEKGYVDSVSLHIPITHE